MERVDVGGSPFDYSRLLATLWADGESFMVVEHDIELTARAYMEAVQCACMWATNPYRGAGPSFDKAVMLDRALGCTRFRAELLAGFPEAVNVANSLDDGGAVCPPGHWKRLDCRLLGVLRQAGHVPHVHSTVIHHHSYEYGCACGAETH